MSPVPPKRSVGGHTPVIPALGKWKQNAELKVILGHIVSLRPAKEITESVKCI